MYQSDTSISSVKDNNVVDHTVAYCVCAIITDKVTV